LDADADGNISRADLARLLHEMQFEYGVTDEVPLQSPVQEAPPSERADKKSEGIEKKSGVSDESVRSRM